MSLDDVDLASRFASGDADTVRVVYQTYGRLVFAIAFRVLGDTGLAEDATQQTFVQAWRAAGSYDPSRPLAAWLTTIAKRVAIDVHRRERRHRDVDDIDDSPSSDSSLVTLPPSADQIHDVAAVRRALDELPTADRQLIRMQHFDELTHAEIATELDIPLGTVKSRTFRAHRRLAGLLSHLRGPNRQTLLPSTRAKEAPMAGDELTPAERAEIDRVLDVLAGPAVWAEPPAALQENVVAAISREAAVTRRRRWVRYVGAAAAAAVLLAVSVTVGVRLTEDRPVRFEAALVHTDLAANASGGVTLTKTLSGWKIELHATGLPRRADGSFYEAWLKNDAGVLVPIGTFNDGRKVVLWSGVGPADYPTLTVTREVADGNQASSGEVVLVAKPHRS